MTSRAPKWLALDKESHVKPDHLRHYDEDVISLASLTLSQFADGHEWLAFVEKDLVRVSNALLPLNTRYPER